MATDWETRYYEQQALHTEARGMLAQERDTFKDWAEKWKARAEAAERALSDTPDRQDAERYRWLRRHCVLISTAPRDVMTSGPVALIDIRAQAWTECDDGSALDRVIDEASEAHHE